jgi:hypothetical protein
MNLGAISSIPRSTTNSLSNADTADVFSFDLNGPGSLTLTLTGLSADADVRLIRDFNNNGVVDDGEEIGRSQQNGTSNESISLPSLAAGRYLVQVYQYEGSTNYRLTLSTTPNGVLGSADNTLATANYIGVLNGSQTFNDFVGDADPNDYYHFILNSPSNFNLSLSGLSADADVQLIQDFNSNGVVDAGEVIAYPFQVGNQPESLDVNLEPGSYFVRVFQYSGDAVYTLSLSANPTTTLLSQTDVAEPDPGNTLETARNLGVLNGSQTINESVSSTDPNDYYRFTLNQSTGFSLSLTNLTSDADVQLLDSTGSLIASSFASGTSPESISRTLVAGTYYVRVYEYTGSTNYTLGLSTNVATQLSTYSPSYGYGLVDADAAVSQALGQPMFPSVPNLGGTGWGLDMINAPEVWAKGYTGQGITVAVVDSGVDYTHPDLDSNIWVNTREIPGNGIDDDGNGFVDDVRGWDFVDNDNTPTDLDGHGTHIAGTIAAENNGFGITGVAYNAHIMPVRVLDATGSGTYDNIAAGIRYAANNGANIINLSLGGPTASDQITSAIQYATQRGSLVVVAAGNGSGSQPMFPANLANLPGVLAVGSVNINKQLAASSNKAGSSVLSYVVAPGVSIYSTTPNNTYQYYSGTSMATPYVSGTAALILSANPKLTPAQVASLLTATANPSGITV